MTDENTGKPCPDWCVNGAVHNDDLLHRGSDFYHEGQAVKVPTAQATHNWEPIIAEIRVIQHEHMDERGISRGLAEVQVDFADGNSFRPDSAEQLARVISELASVARSTPI